MSLAERFPCPLCGARLKAHPLPPIGKKLRCTKCGEKFRFRGLEAPLATSVDSLPVAGLPTADLPVADVATRRVAGAEVSTGQEAEAVAMADSSARRPSLSPGLLGGMILIAVLGLGSGFFIVRDFLRRGPAKSPLAEARPVEGSASREGVQGAGANSGPNSGPSFSEVSPAGAKEPLLKTLTLRSRVRSVCFSRSEESVVVSLLANSAVRYEPRIAGDHQKAVNEILAMETKLAKEEAEYTLERHRARLELVDQIENDKSLSLEQIIDKQTAELLKFDAETKEVYGRKYAGAIERFRDERYAELRKKFGAERPWGEMAAVWDLKKAAPAVVLTQPDLAGSELWIETERPRRETMLEILDPTVRRGWSGFDMPPALVHSDRVLWFRRRTGPMEYLIGAPDSVDLGFTDIAVQHWLLSPDGSRVLIQGVQRRSGPLENRSAAPTEGAKSAFCEIYDFRSKRFTDFLSAALITDTVDCCFSPDGSQLIARSYGAQTPPDAPPKDYSLGAIRRFDLGQSKTIGLPIVFPGKDRIMAIAASPDHSRLGVILEHNPGKFYLIDLTTEKMMPSEVEAPADSLAFSHDSRTIALAAEEVGQDRHQLLLVDAKSGKRRKAMTDWQGYVEVMEFSPDSKILAVGGSTARSGGFRLAASYPVDASSPGSRLFFYDAETGEKLATLVGHTDVVSSLQFSKDGSRLVSGSLDGTVRIWDVKAALNAAAAK